MDLSNYNRKKILILGFGREGISSLSFFLEHCPESEIAVADKAEKDRLERQVKEVAGSDADIKIFHGQDYLVGIGGYDIIVKSPGVPIHIPEVERVFKENKITSQAEIFLTQCPGTIIGITGTKGKSTTSSMIFEILRKAGKKVELVGNIGIPMLPFLNKADEESFFVCELSAHQLYGLKVSPHISVLLNIYEEHLDYYESFSEYIRSKANIALHQSKNDYLIYNSSISEVREIADKTRSKKIAFNECEWNFSGKTNLIGKFNLENAKIAAIVGRILRVDDSVINKTIVEFKPLDNRLELAGVFNGAEYYNDSLSTIQESAVAAIEGLGERVTTLISGGFDRNQPFGKLARAILESNIKTLVFLPTTGEKIHHEILRQAQNPGFKERVKNLSFNFVKTMPEAVKIAFSNTKKGEICLFSAAAASFNGFRDYADRGEQFKNCLAELSRDKNG